MSEVIKSFKNDISSLQSNLKIIEMYEPFPATPMSIEVIKNASYLIQHTIKKISNNQTKYIQAIVELELNHQQ